jgi:hypothetical protein
MVVLGIIIIIHCCIILHEICKSCELQVMYDTSGLVDTSVILQDVIDLI